MAQKPDSLAGIGLMTNRGHSRCAVPWSLSPHPGSLPCAEGELFSLRPTIQTCRLSLRGARCSLSLRERVRVRGNGANPAGHCCRPQTGASCRSRQVHVDERTFPAPRVCLRTVAADVRGGFYRERHFPVVTSTLRSVATEDGSAATALATILELTLWPPRAGRLFD